MIAVKLVVWDKQRQKLFKPNFSGQDYIFVIEEGQLFVKCGSIMRWLDLDRYAVVRWK